tara:strand:+ start:73 stop:465 length:393 start_codon:yes stop_codon:yes gene_type:complete
MPSRSTKKKKANRDDRDETIRRRRTAWAYICDPNHDSNMQEADTLQERDVRRRCSNGRPYTLDMLDADIAIFEKMMEVAARLCPDRPFGDMEQWAPPITDNDVFVCSRLHPQLEILSQGFAELGNEAVLQ